jgi:hypothetical protein
MSDELAHLGEDLLCALVARLIRDGKPGRRRRAEPDRLFGEHRDRRLGYFGLRARGERLAVPHLIRAPQGRREVRLCCAHDPLQLGRAEPRASGALDGVHEIGLVLLEQERHDRIGHRAVSLSIASAPMSSRASIRVVSFPPPAARSRHTPAVSKRADPTRVLQGATISATETRGSPSRSKTRRSTSRDAWIKARSASSEWVE